MTNLDSHVTFILEYRIQYVGIIIIKVSKGDIVISTQNLAGKMSSDLNTQESGKTVLIPVDGSENSERAFQCKYSGKYCHLNYNMYASGHTA